MTLEEIYEYSNTEIQQGLDYADTKNRHDTKYDIILNDVEYENKSYVKFGTLKFDVEGESSIYEVRIRPKQILYSYEDILESDCDVYCECRDFRYVFMNKAYKGLGATYQKYGLVPITDVAGTSLPRHRHTEYSGRQDAPVRNPQNMGAVCKHILLTIDNIRNDVDYKKISDDIETNKFVPQKKKEKIQVDKDYLDDYDDNEMLKKKKDISKDYQKRLSGILSVNMKDIEQIQKDNPLLSINDIMKQYQQELMDLHSYYISKASSEGKDRYYYLPFNSASDIEVNLDKIANHFDKLKSEKYKKDVKTKKDIFAPTDLDAFVKKFYGDEVDVSDIYDNFNIKQYKDFLNEDK